MDFNKYYRICQVLKLRLIFGQDNRISRIITMVIGYVKYIWIYRLCIFKFKPLGFCAEFAAGFKFTP